MHPSPQAVAAAQHHLHLCGDVANPAMCLEGCCCIYCSVSRAYHVMSKRHRDPHYAGAAAVDRRLCLSMLLCDALCCTWGNGALFGSVLVRSMLRDSMHLVDEPLHWYGCGSKYLEDVVVGYCCAPCSVCQVHRALSERGASPGFSATWTSLCPCGEWRVGSDEGGEALDPSSSYYTAHQREPRAAVGTRQLVLPHRPPTMADDATVANADLAPTGGQSVRAACETQRRASPPTVAPSSSSLGLVYGLERPSVRVPDHYVLPPSTSPSPDRTAFSTHRASSSAASQGPPTSAPPAVDGYGVDEMDDDDRRIEVVFEVVDEPSPIVILPPERPAHSA